MKEKIFVIVGDTLDTAKYAYRIKHAMLDHAYQVFCVGKELQSLNDVPLEIDVIDLCTRAERGLKLLQECKKPFKAVVIQPGAESPELLEYLKKQQIPHISGCLLQALYN
ncbi:MAG: CoA-binding protein [Bacillota bacterium]|nr:CoA-binding protein [Bacillota bacterium]